MGERRMGPRVILTVLTFIVGSICNASDDLEAPLRTKREPPPTDGNVLIRVEQGVLRGLRERSNAGAFYVSFRGIPYAQPPLGHLRFKDAQQSRPWQGIRNAWEHEGICLQPSTNLTGFFGEEDCLYLNVYTPLFLDRWRSRLPVMVWIHGGGYTTGSGNSDLYGPEYLVSQDIILVTINYRLGPFGFLYLDEAVHGNVGMKDQVAALRWVQINIRSFGGDPAKVTIFGESTGGSSVHLLMMSPMTKGLFRGAIAQSGHAAHVWASNASALLEQSRQLAAFAGCGQRSDAATVICLRAAPAPALVNATIALINATNQLLPYALLPNVDKQVRGVATFLPESPIELIMKGRVHQVPFINGFTNKEGYELFNFRNYFDENVARQFDNSWDTMVLPSLRPYINSSMIKEALQEIRNFFMEGKPLSNETMPGFIDLFTDIIVAEGTYFTMSFMAKNHKVPVYEYSFTIDDDLNIMKLFSAFNYTGANHADDLGYLFRMDYLPEVPANSSASISRARMVRLWTNFAKYGVPTISSDALLGVTWMPYTLNAKRYLEIGPTLRSNTGLNYARVAFWENFFHRYT